MAQRTGKSGRGTTAPVRSERGRETPAASTSRSRTTRSPSKAAKARRRGRWQPL